jgi:hypothetical protein
MILFLLKIDDLNNIGSLTKKKVETYGLIHQKVSLDKSGASVSGYGFFQVAKKFKLSF